MRGMTTQSSADEIVRLENVYKIFGPQPRGRALKLAKDGLTKNEVQAATDHVVGMTDVSFEVLRGETFVIMGLSGSGKSTAIRTVNKLHDITDGHVWVDGVDVQALHGPPLQQFRREKMGMVFQHFALFPHRSVIDNTGYGLKVVPGKLCGTAEQAEAAVESYGGTAALKIVARSSRQHVYTDAEKVPSGWIATVGLPVLGLVQVPEPSMLM